MAGVCALGNAVRCAVGEPNRLPTPADDASRTKKDDGVTQQHGVTDDEDVPKRAIDFFWVKGLKTFKNA